MTAAVARDLKSMVKEEEAVGYWNWMLEWMMRRKKKMD